MKNILIGLLILVSFQIVNAQDSLTTIILIRHAEKGFDEGGDPSLTNEGKERAIELSRILENETVDRIFTTPFKRTKETIVPLATSKEIDIVEYNPFKLDDTMDMISKLKGQTLVFSGHSNTVPVMVNKLIGEEKYEMIDESVYDNLFIVTISEIGEGTEVNLKYGKQNQEN